MGVSMQPQKPRYRPVNQQGALPPAQMVPGAIAEPPNPTGMVGATPQVGGAGPRTSTGMPMEYSRAPHPGNGSKGIDQVGQGFGEQPEAARRNRFGSGLTPRGGQMGLPPQMPPGQVNGRPGAAPRPPQRPQVGLPPAPPPMPPAPIVEPPNPGGAVGFGNEGREGFDTDLRSQIYTPGGDPRLQGAQNATDAAQKGLGGPGFTELAAGSEGRYRKLLGTGAVEGGPDVNAADGGRYLDEQDAAVAGLGGPSRTELAQQALKDFEAQGEQGLAQRFRKVGQSAAKFGRIGMGDVNAELGSIQGDYERDLMAKRNELARDVSEGDIGDRFRRVDATSNLRRGESGIESGIRGEQRTERGYDTDLAIGNEDRAFDRNSASFNLGGRDADRTVNDRYDQFNAASSLEDRVFGQGQSNRGEFRAERGRQDQIGRQSIEDRIRQRELEQSDKREKLSRAIALMQAGGQVPNLEQLIG